MVPVVVRDHQGKIITDLRQQDFRVFDNDRPHLLSSFQIERRGKEKNGTAASIPSLSDPTASSNVSPATERRFLVFLFDDMHLSFEDLAHARQSATKILADTVNGSDMAAIVSVSGKVNTNLTRDHVKLQKAIESLQPHNLLRATEADCPTVDYYQADQIENQHSEVALQALIQEVFNCSPGLNPQRDRNLAERLAQSAVTRAINLGVQDTQGTLATIGEVVGSMSALPGQRSLIFISPGFFTLAKESLGTESHLLDLSAQSNVTISALDARGLYTTEIDASQHISGSGRVVQIRSDFHRNSATQAENVMAELADGTGGTFFHNSNDLDAGFRRLAEVPECIYLLELSLEDIKPNGSYHRLKIQVDREHVDVETRHGYFAPKPEKKK